MSQPLVFDRALLRRRQVRARACGSETFLLDRVASDLADRLGAVLREFAIAVDLGTPAGAACAALAGVPSIGKLFRVTASPDVDVVADKEALPFRDNSLDLVISALALQF